MVLTDGTILHELAPFFVSDSYNCDKCYDSFYFFFDKVWIFAYKYVSLHRLHINTHAEMQKRRGGDTYMKKCLLRRFVL